VHANVGWSFGPLGRLLACPRFHRWHHTSAVEGRDKNFAGVFPLWDVLFGTYFAPAGRAPTAFGAGDEPVPAGLWRQLAYPFRRAKPGERLARDRV
jgi:sterol desaturase/sphingolipid hydroxylase (fatty acid hydroxylase superfamily)